MKIENFTNGTTEGKKNILFVISDENFLLLSQLMS